MYHGELLFMRPHDARELLSATDFIVGSVFEPFSEHSMFFGCHHDASNIKSVSTVSRKVQGTNTYFSVRFPSVWCSIFVQPCLWYCDYLCKQSVLEPQLWCTHWILQQGQKWKKDWGKKTIFLHTFYVSFTVQFCFHLKSCFWHSSYLKVISYEINICIVVFAIVDYCISLGVMFF